MIKERKVKWKSCTFMKHMETRTHWLEEGFVDEELRFELFLTLDEPTLVKFRDCRLNTITILRTGSRVEGFEKALSIVNKE